MAPDDETFTPEERAAMRERSREMRRGRSGGPKDPGADFDAAVAAMPEGERAIARRLAGLVAEHAPELATRTWYGMPAWSRDGKVICFFQPASKFKARYSTLGFQDGARLDRGSMWPTSFAITALGDEDEAAVVELLLRALGRAL
jgi:uncharacterized protein YdhG (YjbR/CyaY superfamily)